MHGCERAPDVGQLDPDRRMRGAQPLGDRARAWERLGAGARGPWARKTAGRESGPAWRTPDSVPLGPRPSSHNVATTEPAAAQVTVADPMSQLKLVLMSLCSPADN